MIREMIAAFKRYWEPSLKKIDALDLRRVDDTIDIASWHPVPMKKIEESSNTVYAVARSPRHIPWSRRRKELEASARQKRRHLESFREQA